eukprot:9697506-Karenia_brevis.AAC.1
MHSAFPSCRCVDSCCHSNAVCSWGSPPAEPQCRTSEAAPSNGLPPASKTKASRVDPGTRSTGQRACFSFTDWVAAAPL